MTDGSNQSREGRSGSSDEGWDRSDDGADGLEQSPFGPEPGDEPIRPGAVDPENALFVALGVAATVALIVHLGAILT